jgi:hypothetical protein
MLAASADQLPELSLALANTAYVEPSTSAGILEYVQDEGNKDASSHVCPEAHAVPFQKRPSDCLSSATATAATAASSEAVPVIAGSEPIYEPSAGCSMAVSGGVMSWAQSEPAGIHKKDAYARP